MELNTWLTVFFFVEMCLFLFWILEKVGQLRRDKVATRAAPARPARFACDRAHTHAH